MLFDLDGNQMTRVPHKDQFDNWRTIIEDADYDRAVDAIKDRIAPVNIFTSSFLPGRDWTGTPFQPLYVACGKSVKQSGYFFGLIVWSIIMEDDDKWVFKPSEKDDGDPLGTTYWRRHG